jgi:hypothetical protein
MAQLDQTTLVARNGDDRERRGLDGAIRESGAVLVGRVGDCYYFVDSVFRHGGKFASYAGCTGMSMYAVSKEHARESLSLDCIEERFEYSWEEYAEDRLIDECMECDGHVSLGGCRLCGYQSLREYCRGIRTDARRFNYSPIFDCPEKPYIDALRGHVDDLETADISSCGRIFSEMELSDFDEVFNHKALVTCLAYEAGAVSTEYATRIIYNK